MNKTLFQGCTAKKIFTRSFIAAYKLSGINRKQLSDWIRLTLIFEDPTKTLQHGMIYFATIPKYMELYQTGLCLYAFGLFKRQVESLQKYWHHQWLCTAHLGHETIDHYYYSPLLKKHNYSHITDDLIENSLKNFTGTIEQISPSPLHEQPVDSFDSLDDNYDCHDDEYHKNDIEKWIPSRRCPDKTPLIKQCYSIEILDRKDDFVKFLINSDSLFNCRAFIRDLGLHLNCPSSIDSIHLSQLGPIRVEQSLQKHELNYEQMVKSAEEITPSCIEYLKQLRQQYPDAKKSNRFI